MYHCCLVLNGSGQARTLNLGKASSTGSVEFRLLHVQGSLLKHPNSTFGKGSFSQLLAAHLLEEEMGTPAMLHALNSIYIYIYIY